MNAAPLDVAPIDQKNAELYMRLSMLSFNNVTVYGAAHPSAQKSIQDFFVHANKILTGIPAVTLLLERDSFYIEQWRVDKGLSIGKIIGSFKKLGLQSITIERGVSRDHLRDFLFILGDNRTFPSVDAMKQELSNRAITAVRLNYVMYQKVTTDETVVSREGTDSIPSSVAASDGRKAALNELGKVLSLRDLLEKPGQVAEAVLGAAGTENGNRRADMVAQLKVMGEQLSESGADTLSLQQMMEAVYALKVELQEGLRVQRQMGKIVGASDPVLDQVDSMTCDVIVKMVREEYKNGAISTKRLGVIIRRMIPDTKDLQRFLPRLKQALLADGMEPARFLELVQELYKEIQSEGLMEVLEQGADALGMSADEIVDRIKESPLEAARLIVLATEIRQGGGVDNAELSNVLSDYVERLSSSRISQTGDSLANEGGRAFAEMLKKIETELVERFKGQGIPDAVVARVEQQLSQRFQKTLQQLKSSWLFNCLAAGKEVTESYLMHLIEGVVEQEADLAGLKDPLSEALLAKGYTGAEVQKVYEQVASKITRKAPAAAIPKGVLTTNNTLFFLKHQVGLSVRYNNPFSTLMVSVPLVQDAGVLRTLTAEESPIVIAEIFGVGVRLLRDLDLFGSLGTVESNRPFVILPMTPISGAEVVRGRLIEALNQVMVMAREGVMMRPVVVVSAHFFDRQKFNDVRPYLDYVKTLHSRAEKGGSVV